jgi:hypothetical protein
MCNISPILPVFHALSLLALVMRSLCSVLLGRVGILGHHVLELRPQALDLAEFIADLSCKSQRSVCDEAVERIYVLLSHPQDCGSACSCFAARLPGSLRRRPRAVHAAVQSTTSHSTRRWWMPSLFLRSGQDKQLAVAGTICWTRCVKTSQPARLGSRGHACRSAFACQTISLTSTN